MWRNSFIPRSKRLLNRSFYKKELYPILPYKTGNIGYNLAVLRFFQTYRGYKRGYIFKIGLQTGIQIFCVISGLIPRVSPLPRKIGYKGSCDFLIKLALAFVTFCESNAKILLTAGLSQVFAAVVPTALPGFLKYSLILGLYLSLKITLISLQ